MSSEEKPDTLSEEEQSKRWLRQYRNLRIDSVQRVRGLWKPDEGEIGDDAKKTEMRKQQTSLRFPVEESSKNFYLALHQYLIEINHLLSDRCIIAIISDFLGLSKIYALKIRISNLEDNIISGKLTRNSLFMHQITLNSKLNILKNIERGSDPGTPSTSSDSEEWVIKTPRSGAITASSWIPRTPPSE